MGILNLVDNFNEQRKHKWKKAILEGCIFLAGTALETSVKHMVCFSANSRRMHISTLLVSGMRRKSLRPTIAIWEVNMSDRASQVLAQAFQPGQPKSFRTLAEHSDVPRTTLQHAERS